MPDGASYRDHIRAAEAAGIDTGELEAPPAPPGSAEILGLYWQLRRAAGSNGMTPNSLQFSEIKAWQDLAGVQLTPAELDTLVVLDHAALAAFAEK